MNSALNEFSNNRDFGLLIIAIINKILNKNDSISPVIIKQLIIIGENYKGSMRFKIMNSIKQFSK